MQVVSFAESLKDSEGKPLVRSTQIASSIPLPHDVPDLVVTTPAGLMNATTELGPYAGWEWTKLGIVSRYIILMDQAHITVSGFTQQWQSLQACDSVLIRDNIGSKSYQELGVRDIM